MLLIQLIIIQFVTFLALVFILRKIMISSSFSETKRLQALNEQNVRRAQELEEKIEAAENEYKEKIKKAEDEIRALKAKAKEETIRLKEEMIAKGREERGRLITQAVNAKEKMREDIEAQLEGRTVELAKSIFQRILSAKNQRLVHEGFLEEVFEELKNLKEDMLQSHMTASLQNPAEGVQCSVTTAHPLNSADKMKLEEILSLKAGREIAVEEKMDAGIMAGLVIKFGNLIIDGSLAARFKKAAEAAR